MTRVEDDSSRWFQLLQEVEVHNVACKDRHSVFPRGCEDESVVQNSAPVGLPIAFETRKDPGENSGNQPSLPVGRDGAMRGSSFDNSNDLFGCLARAGMIGIQEAAWRNQFGFGDRGMPSIRRSNCRFARLWETALQDVHVNCCVVKKRAGQIGCAFHERERRWAARNQWLSPLLRLQATENTASAGARTQDRLL